jgi:hypothetical protein
MNSNIFLGENISKLALTHCGSLYLKPEQSISSPIGQARFESFVNNWCNSVGCVEILAGTIERGYFKNGIHLQWVAVAEDSLVNLTKKYLSVSKHQTYNDKKLVKSADENSITGFTDKFHIVQGVRLKSPKAIVSIESIIDKSSIANYTYKFASWGVNTVYYLKN